MSEERLFYVYMVADRSRILYVGFTSDLYQRMIQHRGGRFERFTSRYRCDRLVWFERYGGPLEAIAREKQIKRWREKKVFLIEREIRLGRICRRDGDRRLKMLFRGQQSKSRFLHSAALRSK